MTPIKLQYQLTQQELNEFAKSLSKRPADPGGRAKTRPIFIWALASIVFLIFFMVHDTKRPPSSSPPAPRPNLFIEFIINMVPWIFVYLVIWYLFIRPLRNKAKATPELIQPKTAEITDDFLKISLTTIRQENDWLSFRTSWESKSLFILQHTDKTCQILPKRAFNSEADLRQFRSLLAEKIGDRTTSRFEVLPQRPLERALLILHSALRILHCPSVSAAQ